MIFSKLYLFSCFALCSAQDIDNFMMFKMFSCADLFLRPLYWNIYRLIMWFLCGFEYIAKITTVYLYIAPTVTEICVCSQRNIREKSGNFFLPTTWQPWFEFTNGYEMMHKAWRIIEEAPYCFSRSSVKFQGHTALKMVEFDPNWAFPDCNSSFNTPMVTKWCTKLEVA